jgi:hypothetical protein
MNKIKYSKNNDKVKVAFMFFTIMTYLSENQRANFVAKVQ